MKFGTGILIAVGVVVVHAVVFFFLSGKKPLPEPVSRIPRPNFIAKEGEFMDEKTGKKTMIREFTVSTQLAPPDGGSSKIQVPDKSQ